MDFRFLAQVISVLADVLSILVFIWAILSWVVSPYHPLREALDRIVDPMLSPIRRVIPLAGGMDFSPLIFILLVELLARVIISLLLSL